MATTMEAPYSLGDTPVFEDAKREEAATAALTADPPAAVEMALVESNVVEDSGVDEVGQDDFVAYSQSIAQQLSHGQDAVGEAVMNFLQLQGGSLDQHSTTSSDFPPFDFGSEVPGGIQRIEIDITIHRSSESFQVTHSSRCCTLLPADAAAAAASQGAHPAEGELGAETSAEVAPHETEQPHFQSQFPFEPPDEVKGLLGKDDWEALTSAWQRAEEQAMAWASGEIDDFGYGEGGGSMSSNASPHQSSRRRKRRPQWNQDFHLLGKDSDMPPPLRRYFDKIPAESSIPKEAIRPEVARLHGPGTVPDIWSKAHPSFAPDIAEATKRRLARSGPQCQEVLLEQREKQWFDRHEKSVTVDNPGLHPFLRHYFDRRGYEGSYRQRPFINKSTPVMRPRTPGRPSTREKIMRHCMSEPSVNEDEPVIDAAKRAEGSITWSRRCLMYGPDMSTMSSTDGKKIPWVYDHHRLESEDNEILNPLLRHYFEREGIESSFRARGRHYGRPLKSVIGLPPVQTCGPGGTALSSLTQVGMVTTSSVDSPSFRDLDQHSRAGSIRSLAASSVGSRPLGLSKGIDSPGFCDDEGSRAGSVAASSLGSRPVGLSTGVDSPSLHNLDQNSRAGSVASLAANSMASQPLGVEEGVDSPCPRAFDRSSRSNSVGSLAASSIGGRTRGPSKGPCIGQPVRVRDAAQLGGAMALLASAMGVRGPASDSRPPSDGRPASADIPASEGKAPSGGDPASTAGPSQVPADDQPVDAGLVDESSADLQLEAAPAVDAPAAEGSADEVLT